MNYSRPGTEATTNSMKTYCFRGRQPQPPIPMFHKVILLPGKKPPVNVLLWLLSTVRQRDYAVFPEKQNKTKQTKPNQTKARRSCNTM